MSVRPSVCPSVIQKKLKIVLTGDNGFLPHAHALGVKQLVLSVRPSVRPSVIQNKIVLTGDNGF